MNCGLRMWDCGLARAAAGLLVALALGLALPGAARAQARPAPTDLADFRTYVAAGPTAAAALERLREALQKVPGVQAVQLRERPGGAMVRIRGEVPGGTLLQAAARSTGYELRPTPTRIFAAAGPSDEAKLEQLREALAPVGGVEQVELSAAPGGAAVRVRGDAPARELIAAARPAGFTLQPVAAYVASGPDGDDDRARLRAALARLAGVEEMELRPLAGGATLLVYGDAAERALAAAAEGAGYVLRPLANATGPREFKVRGQDDPAAAARLRTALEQVEGAGAVEFQTAADGTRRVVTGPRARPREVLAAARAAGFELRPVETVTLPSAVPEVDRNTPPGPGERILEDLTRVGDLAPDFALLKKEGDGTVRLSDYQGKKPVVLIFGSYT